MNTDKLNTIKSNFSYFRDKPFRDGQAEIIEKILSSKKKVSVLCAPTGSGKSLCSMIMGAAYEKFCYLVSSKQLQEQLMHEFPEVEIMQGRNNYPCIINPQLSASECIHTPTTPCHFKSTCPYEIQKKRVLEANYQVLNYNYFITEANYIGRFTDYPIIIADESDMLEATLTEFISLNISSYILHKLHIHPPKRKTSTAIGALEMWKEWAQSVIPKILKEVDRVDNELKEEAEMKMMSDEDTAQLVKYKQTMQSLSGKLRVFIDNVDDTWIYEETDKGWSFKPTWLTPTLSNMYFFRHAQRFVLMSATFPTKQVLAHMLGIGVDDIDYYELPSTFPVDNRRVKLEIAGDLKYNKKLGGIKTLDVDNVVEAVKGILDQHKDVKGVIHTVNWKLNQAIMDIDSPRLVTHDSRNKNDQLKYFMDSDEPLVFVSPSSARGINLPDDLCRFIILLKAPYLSLADKLTSRRAYSGKTGQYWYSSMCAQEVVQMTGRGVRHKGDSCVSYILDKQLGDLILDNQQLFPKYWMDSVDVW